MASPKKQGPSGEAPDRSKLDGLLGSHVRDVLVFILILVLISSLVFGKELDATAREAIKAGFLLLLGFFTGSKLKAQ